MSGEACPVCSAVLGDNEVYVCRSCWWQVPAPDRVKLHQMHVRRQDTKSKVAQIVRDLRAKRGARAVPSWPCVCADWCRTDIQFKDGKPLPATRHHPRCSHVDESLIDVFKVSDGSSAFFTTDERAAKTEAEGCEDITITREKMHSEIYEALEEFSGF